jgi:hypothetical protein
MNQTVSDLAIGQQLRTDFAPFDVVRRWRGLAYGVVFQCSLHLLSPLLPLLQSLYGLIVIHYQNIRHSGMARQLIHTGHGFHRGVNHRQRNLAGVGPVRHSLRLSLSERRSVRTMTPVAANRERCFIVSFEHSSTNECRELVQDVWLCRCRNRIGHLRCLCQGNRAVQAFAGYVLRAQQ